MDTTYTVHIFDQILYETNRAAVLENAFDIEISREVSKPCMISFSLPNADAKLDAFHSDSMAIVRPIVDINNVVKVYDGTTVKAIGIIIGPLDKTASPVHIQAIGISTKLSRYRTPANWNIEDTPANVLRALLKKYRFNRITTNDEFDAGAFNQTQREDLGSTDSGEEGGAVLLDFQYGGITPYYTAGDWASATIDMGTGLDAWRRIKFKAIFGDVTSVTFQTRTSADDISYTAWSTAVELLDPNECEIDGFPIASIVQRYIQVKVNFTTSDTEISPCVQALEIQGTYGNILTEGTGFADLPTENIFYNPSYENQFKLMCSLIDEQNFQWEETNAGAINIAEQLGSDLTSQYALHEYRHCEVLEYEEDDSDLVNYLVTLGTGAAGIDQLVVIVEDSQSQNMYGIRMGIYENAIMKTVAGLTTAANAYLAEYAYPKKTLRLRVIDTPDGTWDFAPGDRVKFVSPNRNTNTDLRIAQEVRRYTQKGFEVELTLTNPAPAVKSFSSEYLKRLDAFAASTDAALKHYESGELWTDWIGASDTTWNSINIRMGFTPTNGYVVPLQIVEDVTKYYTQPGTQIEYRVVDVRTGEMAFEYRRTVAGSNQIRVHFLWWAWSRRRTFGSIGLGSLIK